MSTIVDTTQKAKEEKYIINPFIIISLCALTLSIFSLLIVIIYLNFQFNRITDIRNISKYYHEIINNVIKEMNLESDCKDYKEQLEDKNLVLNGEYNIYLPSVELYNNTLNEFKKKLYGAGIGISTIERNNQTCSLLLNLNGVKFAKVNINKKTDQEKDRNEILETGKEIFSQVRNLLLDKYVSTTEIIESLPQPVSNGSSTWFYKKISLFLPTDVDNNQLLEDIKRLILQKYLSSEIKTTSNNVKNAVEYNLYIDGKHLLTISVQKFSDNINKETTEVIGTSLSTRFLNENYSEKNLPFLLYYNTNQNMLESQNSNEKETYDKNITNQERKQRPQIAIILDDGGYRDPAGDPALDLTSKINMSILPGTRFAKELAKKAEQKGFEIMLHMPMQTKQGVKKGSFPCELLINMSEEEIKKQTEYALEQIPGVKGVNNHTGGVFTLKETALRAFMKVLKRKKLFFIDSVVVSGSKAYSVAIEEGVPSLQRDIFLDHEYTIPKIKENFEILKKTALKKGKAIGIGHFRDLTIEVLKEELPKLEEQGFELVHVSELLK